MTSDPDGDVPAVSSGDQRRGSRIRQPDAGYAETDFDRYYRDASGSDLLEYLFGEYFDPAAPWDVRGFNFITMSGLRRCVALLDDAPEGPLLDAGSGRGGTGLWLAERTGRPLHGIDVSVVAIEQARTLARTRKLAAVYSRSALEATGLPGGQFAAIICLDSLLFATDPDAAARELLRVTRPGGQLLATTWYVPNGNPRHRQDLSAILAEAGWEVKRRESHPDWLEAQLRLYSAVQAEPNCSDPAVQRLRDEGTAIGASIRGGERLLIEARATMHAN
jgi:2-polyprenyl-3-methyl-5-hydroxy-6-metoxy-1,4-benzoquinol methylase